MDIERVVQYECRVCGRKIDVTRTGDVYAEPVFCCGVEAAEVGMQEEEPIFVPPQPVMKKAAKKAAKKKVKKKAAKKKVAKKKAKKAVKKKAVKKKAKKTAKKRRR